MRLKLLAAFSLFASTASALEFKPLINSDLRGGFAMVQDGASSGQALGNLFFVPALKFSEAYSLLPTLYVNASGQTRSIEEDTLFIRTLMLGFKPSFKMKLGPKFSLSARIDAKRSMNIESLNESFGTGHYDYEELGGGLLGDFGMLPVPFSLNADFGHRGYPNNHGLSAGLTAFKNYYVKDFYFIKTGLKSDFSKHASFNFSMQMKSYTDSYIIKPDSQTDLNTLQSDLLLNASIDGGLALNKALAVSYSLGYNSNSSNQSSLDISAPNPYQEHSSDYSVISLSPGIAWRSGPWRTALSYSLSLRSSNRHVQKADASYSSTKISDIENGIDLSGAYQLSKRFALVSGASARFVSSNQELAKAGQPSYSFYNVNAGVEFNWARD